MFVTYRGTDHVSKYVKNKREPFIYMERDRIKTNPVVCTYNWRYKRHTNGFQYKQIHEDIVNMSMCKCIHIFLHWFLKAIHQQKELGLFGKTADLSTDAEKVQDEPRTSHHARE